MKIHQFHEKSRKTWKFSILRVCTCTLRHGIDSGNEESSSSRCAQYILFYSNSMSRRTHIHCTRLLDIADWLKIMRIMKIMKVHQFPDLWYLWSIPVTARYGAIVLFAHWQVAVGIHCGIKNSPDLKRSRRVDGPSIFWFHQTRKIRDFVAFGAIWLLRYLSTVYFEDILEFA